MIVSVKDFIFIDHMVVYKSNTYRKRRYQTFVTIHIKAISGVFVSDMSFKNIFLRKKNLNKMFCLIYYRIGKTKVEIQKAYRERLKAKLGEEYLKKVIERVRKDYVPSTLLTSSKRKERNERNKIRNRLCRQRQKELLRGLVEHETSDGDTNDYVSNMMETSSAPETPRSPQRIVVSLPAVTKAAKI